MNAVQQHLDNLGKTGRDKVTGLEGVIDSLCFDLYGCIQYMIKPKAKENGELVNSYWIDVTRVEVINDERVMPLPDYDSGYIAEGKKGAADKPASKA